MAITARIHALPQRLGLIGLAVVSLGVCAGCSGRSLQADNPVLAAAPPRIRRDIAANSEKLASRADTSEKGEIAQTSFSESADSGTRLSRDIGDVAATVNGTPILVADVLERFTPQLRKAEEQLSAEDLQELKRQIIEKELPAHIEQAILVDHALSQLNADQRKMVDEQLDKFFGEYLGQIQAELGAGSAAELEGMLQQQGTSITNLQRSFNNRQLASQGMGLLKPQEPTVTRREILAEYQNRLEEFTEPEQVKWQQIWISYARYGGKQQAFQTLDKVIDALKSGQSFDDVAREYSDGVMASNGGHWDWTGRGALADEDVERMLFELPVGEIGQVVSGEKAFQLVRVTERKPQTTAPFAGVQDQLIKEIKERKQQKQLDKVLADLKQQAVVTTMIDTATPEDQ